jgi:hypothetical protein
MSRTRFFLAIAFALAASAATAEEVMNASAARAFVAGRLFSYTCFDGTEGSGRIFNDGSAMGTVRPGGRSATRYIQLPANTLYVNGDRICATLRGMPWDPCFNLTRTSDAGFRGAVSGLGFMYCDFSRGRARVFARRRGPTAAAQAPAPLNDAALLGTLPGYIP